MHLKFPLTQEAGHFKKRDDAMNDKQALHSRMHTYSLMHAHTLTHLLTHTCIHVFIFSSGTTLNFERCYHCILVFVICCTSLIHAFKKIFNLLISTYFHLGIHR